MIKKISLLLIVITACFSEVSAFPGETRKYFKDWLVVCQNESQSPGIRGICRASTGIRNKRLFPYGDGTIFQLTAQRKKYSDYHIEFYHTLEGHYPSNEVSLKFDNKPVIKLATVTEGNLARLTPKQSKKIIPLIRSGRFLTVSYVSQSGKRVSVKVSLRGSTASLLFIENFYKNEGGKSL